MISRIFLLVAAVLMLPMPPRVRNPLVPSSGTCEHVVPSGTGLRVLCGARKSCPLTNCEKHPTSHRSVGGQLYGESDLVAASRIPNSHQGDQIGRAHV